MADEAVEYFDHLLGALRATTELAWIADEIDAEIAAGGGLIEKEWREPGRRGRAETGLAIKEFSSREQLMIALRIVWERTRVAYSLWEDTRDLLRERVEAQEVLFFDSDREQTYVPFAPGFPEAMNRLQLLLREVAKECHLEGPDVARIEMEPRRSLEGATKR